MRMVLTSLVLESCHEIRQATGAFDAFPLLVGIVPYDNFRQLDAFADADLDRLDLQRSVRLTPIASP